MPIYAYRCESCGLAKDVLQKLSDPVLSTCPACGAETFRKQVTAAGFQLKGSGWYATDFRGGGNAATPPAGESGPASAPAAAGTGKAAESPAASPASAPASSTSGSAGAGPSASG